MTDYIAEADRLAQSRRDTRDESARAELARREFDALAQAAESQHDISKLLTLRLRMAKLPAIETSRRIDMLIRAGACAERAGDRDQALSLAEGALEIATNHGDRRGRIDALNELGIQWRMREDFDKSEALLRESRDLAVESGDKAVLAGACMNLSNTLRRQLKPDEAAEQIHLAVRIYRGLGDLGGAAQALLAIAHLEDARGRHEEEREILEEAVQLAELAGEHLAHARALGNLGLTLIQLGEPDRALERLNEATKRFREIGLVRDAICGMLAAAGALDERGETARALDLANEGAELARHARHPDELCLALAHQGAYLISLDRHQEAYARATESCALLRDNANLRARFTNAETFGRIALSREAYDEALAHFERCEQLSEPTNEPELKARSFRLQAETLKRMGDHGRARDTALRGLELLDSMEGARTVEYLQAVAVSAEIERNSGNTKEARFLAEDAQMLRRELNLPPSPRGDLRRALEFLDELAPEG